VRRTTAVETPGVSTSGSVTATNAQMFNRAFRQYSL
jgi:hypothetical protein